MKKLLFILGMFGWAVAGNAWAVVDVDLTGDTGHLEYQVEDYAGYQVARPKNGAFGPPGLLLDVNGDGFQDYIRSNIEYVTAVGLQLENHVTYYQINLPPKYCRNSGPSCSLKEVQDLDGDGLSEVVIVGHTEDNFQWGFWIIDPRQGTILSFFELEGGPETRLDEFWDGNYSVAGVVNCPVDGAERVGLVLTVNVGHDVEGRGVRAVDPWSGETLWRFITGPNPLEHSTTVTDLDGDGSSEVLVYGRSPHNLGGRKIGGFSDDESRLFVLDNRGRLLWTERLGGWYGGGFLITADLDGDGALEIITSTRATPEVWGEVVVWSHDGQALARHEERDQFQNLALIPGDEFEPTRLAVSGAGGILRIFDITATSLDLVARLDLGAYHFINAVADILPPDGLELVVTDKSGLNLIIGRDLKILARHQGPLRSYHQNMMPWRPQAGLDLLMPEMGPGFPLMFSKAPPPPFSPAKTLGAVALALLLAAGLFIWWKKPFRQKGDPVALREVRLNLLEDLELSNHGAVAPLKCLRRLIWHMNAMATGLGDNESIGIRLRETWTESVENALPHLAGILDRARLAGLAGANVDYAARALEKVRMQLGELEKSGFDVARFEEISTTLTAETAKADDALKDLRQEVAAYFHSNLAATVTRVLRANALALEEHRITIQTGFLARMAAGGEDFSAGRASPAVTCLIDPVELDFVLDNLVGNAVRAMENAARKNLAVTWSTADGMVTVDVRDTGCGIPDDNRDRIMTTQFSTREGGGTGLPRSRKILRKYGGGLMILDTSVGHGTTFRVTLPTV